jgi:ribosomal protein L11 methyltransferase
LIAALLNIKFEGFCEKENMLCGYITIENFDLTRIKELDIVRSNSNIKPEYKIIESKNWNEEWEKSYSPVVIAGNCLIRAPFHPVSGNYPYEIVIEPKMAFGTGHHATTHMIAEHLINTDLKGKYLFDMGCGSGILGIIAAMKGAQKTELADIDAVAVETAAENIQRNNVTSADVFRGSIELLRSREPDIITANINKLTLLEHIRSYYNSLSSKGSLIISGITKNDSGVMLKKYKEAGFTLEQINTKDEWVMLVLIKSE